MATTFDVVAEPMRRRILDLLRERPRPVGELVELLGISQPGVSKHLRILREARLVRVRPDAQQRWYEVDAETFARYRADPSLAHGFVERCKRREMDHLLLLQPGTDRGSA